MKRNAEVLTVANMSIILIIALLSTVAAEAICEKAVEEETYSLIHTVHGSLLQPPIEVLWMHNNVHTFTCNVVNGCTKIKNVPYEAIAVVENKQDMVTLRLTFENISSSTSKSPEGNWQLNKYREGSSLETLFQCDLTILVTPKGMECEAVLTEKDTYVHCQSKLAERDTVCLFKSAELVLHNYNAEGSCSLTMKNREFDFSTLYVAVTMFPKLNDTNYDERNFTKDIIINNKMKIVQICPKYLNIGPEIHCKCKRYDDRNLSTKVFWYINNLAAEEYNGHQIYTKNGYSQLAIPADPTFKEILCLINGFIKSSDQSKVSNISDNLDDITFSLHIFVGVYVLMEILKLLVDNGIAGLIVRRISNATRDAIGNRSHTNTNDNRETTEADVHLLPRENTQHNVQVDHRANGLLKKKILDPKLQADIKTIMVSEKSENSSVKRQRFIPISQDYIQ